MYVYRDTGSQPDDPAAAAPGPSERDAAYWYDLPGTGGGGDATPRAPQETRGPFEPLLSSADPPATTPRFSASLDDAEPAPPEAAHSDEAPGPAADDGQDTAHAHARKLEQIKDLYLTAEAIGEANVDKHFDQLLAQQRELIGEYFKQSSAGRPAAGPRIKREPSRPAPQVRSRASPGMPPRPAARRAHPRVPGSPPISPAYGDQGRRHAGHCRSRPRGGGFCHRP